MLALRLANFLALAGVILAAEVLSLRVIHTGRTPFGLAGSVVKKRFLCKVDYCDDEETSPLQGGKHA